jgi:hypothetical protein
MDQYTNISLMFKKCKRGSYYTRHYLMGSFGKWNQIVPVLPSFYQMYQFYQYQITLLELLYVPRSFDYCYL